MGGGGESQRLEGMWMRLVTKKLDQKKVSFKTDLATRGTPEVTRYIVLEARNVLEDLEV